MSPRTDKVEGRAEHRRAPLASMAPVFAALGDETRLEIVEKLCSGEPMSISELASGTTMTRQAVTKHLRVLARSGLAHDMKSGRERLWQAEPKRLDDARRSLEHIARQWDHALQNLKKLVEE
jgi:DNA-binding transcriptional ArsR family regulator